MNPRRHKGTCNWFCQHPKYAQWLGSAKPGLLLVTADPGTGKSVLARFLIEEELRTHQEDATIVYFFFKDVGEQRKLASDLSVILFQRLDKWPAVFDTVGDWSKGMGTARLRDPNELWALFE